MKIFDWLSHDQKEAMAEWFIEYQQYVGTGKGLFSTVTEPAKWFFGFIGLATSVVAPDYILNNTFTLGLVIFGFFIILPYFLGWWWDKRRYFHKQAEWGNRRNDMKAQLDRIEERLKAMEGVRFNRRKRVPEQGTGAPSPALERKTVER